MTDKQPEALVWAGQLELLLPFMRPAAFTASTKAIAELRRLHEVNAELVEALSWLVAAVDADGYSTKYQRGLSKASYALAKAQGKNND